MNKTSISIHIMYVNNRIRVRTSPSETLEILLSKVSQIPERFADSYKIFKFYPDQLFTNLHTCLLACVYILVDLIFLRPKAAKLTL